MEEREGLEEGGVFEGCVEGLRSVGFGLLGGWLV